MILAYSFAVLIGISLGLLGGGGSILTVPVLIYALNFPAKEAIAMSLAIVGIASFIGSVSHYKKGNIHLKIALIFGPVAMIGSFLGSKISKYIASDVQLLLFAFIMLLASFFMFKGKKQLQQKETEQKINFPLLILQAQVTGLITGIVGVGGGFMIVPALVLMAQISMKQAIGTSLIIIALNSLTGFLGYANHASIDWIFLLQFSGFTTAGIFLGSYLVQYVNQEKLKKIFAIFLVLVSIFIIYQNTFIAK